MNPLPLTIITVCRNEEANIECTCKSIAGQTWRHFEWIVIDGASTDGTLEIVRKYGDSIHCLVSESDRGIYNAMNKGIRMARGEYVLFMNGGDAFHHREVLEEVFGGGCQEADVLYGDYSFEKDGVEHLIRTPEKIVSPLYFVNAALNHQSSFIRREMFERYGYYDETLKIVSDWKFWIILALNGRKFKKVPVNVALFDTEGVSTARNDLVRKESTPFLSAYFYEGELADCNRYTTVTWYYLFGRIPLLKVKSGAEKTKLLLFGVLPILSKVRKVRS